MLLTLSLFLFLCQLLTKRGKEEININQLNCNSHNQFVHSVQARAYNQGRNHVFKVGGPIPWSRYYYPSTKK